MTSGLKSVGTIAAVVGLMAGISAVSAHHSGTMFDPARTESVTGTVKELRWVNPHVSLLVFDTLKEGEEPSEWLLEMTSPSVLARLGWTRTSFKVGDQVQANMHPLRDAEEHGGSLQTIKSLETGKTYTTNLRAQETLSPD
jgi:Family of unknown function (DUF6152)